MCIIFLSVPTSPLTSLSLTSCFFIFKAFWEGLSDAEYSRWAQSWMSGNPGKTRAQLNRCHRCANGLVHLARRSVIHSLRKRARIYSWNRSQLDSSCRGKDRIHRTRFTLGKRLLRKLQCQTAGRTSKRRSLLHFERSTNHNRAMEETLQHQETT